MNKAILMGRLTKDPEMKYTANSNVPVCKFTLAVNRKFNKQGQEKQADFIQIVAWDKLAEFCGKYFQKGRQVAVVGRIQTGSWDDADGKRHYTTDVIAEDAYFADSKPGGPSGDEQGSKASGDGFFETEGTEDELPF